MRNTKAIIFSAVAISITVGCSSSAENDDTSVDNNTGTPSVAEPVALAASANTRAKIGVAAWGIASEAGLTTLARGYNGAGKVIVEISERTDHDDKSAWVEVKVDGERGTGRMRLEADLTGVVEDADVETTFVMKENSLPENVFDAFTSDAEANEAKEASGGGSLRAKGLSPQTEGSLTKKDCVNLSKECMTTSLTAGAKGAISSKACLTVGAGVALAAGCRWIPHPITKILMCVGAAIVNKNAKKNTAKCAVDVGKSVAKSEEVKQNCSKTCDSDVPTASFHP